MQVSPKTCTTGIFLHRESLIAQTLVTRSNGTTRLPYRDFDCEKGSLDLFRAFVLSRSSMPGFRPRAKGRLGHRRSFLLNFDVAAPLGKGL